MDRKYSVFLMNVGSCSDRYCGAYAPPFTMRQLFERVASIDLLKGVDLVATPDFLANASEAKDLLEVIDYVLS